jgi:cellulose synthase/poly-beta-1,6-N-acetylglucosamine synthase-like glycosyltransferase
VKVSLVATVKDAGPHIEEFLASVQAQTRQADEVVVVDGGSSDGTWEALQQAEGILALSEPEANIARGRNMAIRAAAHDVIAVTDADCVLDPDWLARILEPIERGADLAAGFYRPLGDSFVQVCAAAVSLPELEELRPGWMPSSRSLALRRDAFEAAGGYPEWLDVGEDMYLNHRLVESGARMELAPAAVANWRLRPTLAATWRQYARYAEGDALAGMYPQRHAIRFATYALGALALVSKRRWPRVLAGLAALAYASKPVRRALRRLPAGSAKRPAALVAVPAMMGFLDAAKMYGYLEGLARRGERAPGQEP